MSPAPPPPSPREPEIISLDGAPKNKLLEVIEVPHGRGVDRSLAQLGVCATEKLRVRSSAPWGGPLLVDVAGSTVAIGRGLARRIKVRLLRRQKKDETCQK